jgi:VCBS repeat-containing protein
MGKKHHGHWVGKGHSHHEHNVVNGTRDDDVLKGSDKNDTIKGHAGDDQLFGYAGNDKLDGGKGNDLLDGGAGSDKVFGGKGDDVATYVMSANLSGDACGSGPRDFYDGGKGCDTLQLVLTKQESELSSVLDDIARFEAFLLDHANPRGDHGPVFHFNSFNLAAQDFEKLDVVIIGNDAPVARIDAWDLNEDGDLTVAAPGVLINDDDPDDQPQPLTAVNFTAPSHGTLTFNANGAFTYTPDDDYFGTDSFTYQASDGQDLSPATLVSLTVHEVNDAPVVGEDSVTVAEDQKIQQIDVLDNDKPGPDNESGQTLVIVSAHATHGSVGINPNGTLSYEPDPDYFGDDTIDYTVKDDGTTAGIYDPLQASGHVLVTVTEVNDVPTAVTDDLQLTRNSDGSPIAITLSELLANDIAGPDNESGQLLEVLTERLPPMTQRGGMLEYDESTQTIWYTPPDEFPTPGNEDRFSYWIEDNGTTNGEPDALTDIGSVDIKVSDAVDVAAASADVDLFA